MKKGNIGMLGSLLILLLLAGCGEGVKDLDECEAAAQGFMDAMANGNPNGALEFCDESFVQGSHVHKLWRNEDFAEFWNNYEGLDLAGEGAYAKDDKEFFRLENPKVKGNPGYTLVFELRKIESAWKIRKFQIILPKK